MKVIILSPPFFPLKHFVWQFPEGHHQMPGSVHQCVSREKKLSACRAQGTFSPPKLIFIHKSTLRNGLSSHCVHSRGWLLQYFCTEEDGRWKIGVCVQTRVLLCCVHCVLLCWAVGIPRGMNPLKLFLPGPTGSGNYRLFSHCDLYGATSSWPISHCGRQACKGCSVSW